MTEAIPTQFAAYPDENRVSVRSVAVNGWDVEVSIVVKDAQDLEQALTAAASAVASALRV